MTPKLIPKNETAEKAIISICSQYPHYILDVKQDRFLNPTHSAMFAELAKLHAESKPTGLLAFTSHAESIGKVEYFGGYDYITEVLCTAMECESSFDYYLEQLEKSAAYRRLIVSCTKAIDESCMQSIPIEELISSISNSIEINESTKFPNIKSQLMSLVDDLENTEPKERFSTGLKELDDILYGGIERKEIFIVAAPTGFGKSIMLGMIALEALKKKKNVAIFSLEMPESSVLQRFISNLSEFNVRPVGEKKLSTYEHSKLLSSIKQISESHLFLYDNETDLTRILSIATKLQKKHGLDVLIVDYLQRLDQRTDMRSESIAECSRMLKTFALKNDIVVATASQLNDDGQIFGSREPGMDADILAYISDTEIKLSKNRRGKKYPDAPAVRIIRRGDIAKFELLI